MQGRGWSIKATQPRLLSRPRPCVWVIGTPYDLACSITSDLKPAVSHLMTETLYKSLIQALMIGHMNNCHFRHCSWTCYKGKGKYCWLRPRNWPEGHHLVVQAEEPTISRKVDYHRAKALPPYRGVHHMVGTGVYCRTACGYEDNRDPETKESHCKEWLL